MNSFRVARFAGADLLIGCTWNGAADIANLSGYHAIYNTVDRFDAPKSARSKSGFLGVHRGRGRRLSGVRIGVHRFSGTARHGKQAES
jgi:hypothetical protein